MVWNLISSNISCSAPFSIYRITIRNRFQFCGLILYQVIKKKAIEDLEKESSKHRMVEQNYTSKVPKSFTVDDIFAVFKTNESCSKFLDILNSQHKNIKFTVEYGSELMCFLDVQIKVKENGCDTWK